MKNRLQFNRIPRLFENREQANEFLRNYVDPAMRPEFIPLVGEPIVARYKDEDGKKQLILAVGKSVASGNVEYHFIDTAQLKEDIAAAAETAGNAEDVANQALSAATEAAQSVANYFVILKNMIEDGIDLDNGSYFDDDDPTKDPSTCGKLKKFENTNYLDDAQNMREADILLDQALGEASDTVRELSANTVAEFNEVKETVNELSGGTIALVDELSGGTVALVNGLSAGTIALVDELSGGTVGLVNELSAGTIALVGQLSADTAVLDNKIIEAVGLNEDGEYVQVTGSTYIRDAESVKDADRLLDSALNDLSANTIAADQVLAEKITELENVKILGADAIKVTASGADSTVSLKLADNELVLAQDIYGLKANITLYYSKEDKKIYLLAGPGKDTPIAEIDATDFVKDGMLDHVDVFVATEEDHRKYPQLVVGETYLALYFNTDAVSGGTISPVFISVKNLVDVYTVSATSLSYLTIEGYEIRANVEDDNYSDSLAKYSSIKSLCGVTENILAGTGLNTQGPGEYHRHDDTHFIKNASSLDEADVLLDQAIWALSGSGGGGGDVQELEQKVRDLSGTTKSFSAGTVSELNDLNDRLSAVESEISGSTGVTELSAATVGLSAATVDIDERLTAAEAAISANTGVTELSAATVDIDERLTAAEAAISANTGVRELSAATINLSSATVSIESHMTGEYIPLSGYVISSGSSKEELTVTSGDSVNEAFGKVQKQIFDDEEVIAEALNDLNTRLSQAETTISANTGVTELSAATVNEFTNVYNKITNVSGDVITLSSATVNEITNIHNEIANVSGDVIDLSAFTAYLSANTLGVLTVNLNEVEQGKYCPSASTTIEVDVTGADVPLTGYEIACGTTLEELVVTSADTVNDAFGKIQKQIYDNERVIAGAFNDINDRVRDLESDAITGVSVNGVAQPIVGNVANIQVSESGSYTEGSGITITNNKEIRIKLANKGDVDFIKLDGDGLYLSGLSEMSGLQALSGAVVNLSAVTSAVSENVSELSAATTALSATTVIISGIVDSLADSIVQSDWNEADTTSPAFIQNKPYVPKIVKLTTAEYNALTDKDPDTLYILVD